MSSQPEGPLPSTPLFDLSKLDPWSKTIETAESPQAIFDSFCKAIEPFGFTFASMGRLLPPLPGNRSDKNVPRAFHLSKGAEEWIKYLVESGDLVTKSPLVLHGFRVSVPFRWREAYTALSEDQMLHVQRSRSYGLKYGICFPILQERTSPALMSLGRATDFNLALQDIVILEVLVRKAFERMFELVELPPQEKALTLTDREREVLTLVARGKTNWEIGTIMSISEFSVRDYLKDLSKRMGTSNRTHTVTKAIRFGLILP